jgi:hypothetical protein
MRIGIYDPYLEALGGGEKVILSVLAEAAMLPNARVTLFAPVEPDPVAWATRLAVDVSPTSFTWQRAADADVTAASADLDLLIVLDNDFPPPSRARRSVAIIQFPTLSIERPISGRIDAGSNSHACGTDRKRWRLTTCSSAIRTMSSGI